MMKFEDLDVWKKAARLSADIYRQLKELKDYGFKDQITRSGLSVPSNTCPVKQLEDLMLYTYVLQSTRDMNFYVGFTKNLKLRFEQHNNGLVESTRDRRPFDLIYYEACINENDARHREKYLKTYHGRMFIKKRLKSYLTG